MKVDLNTLCPVQMQLTDIDEVMAIENAVYTHPWSRGNFIDSLSSDDEGWVVRSLEGELLGYFVQMPVVDEMHLLTIAVKTSAQGQGIGTWLLNHMARRAQLLQKESVLLEVRVSNVRAIAVYIQFGFIEIGFRKNYYSTIGGLREDALIFKYTQRK